MKIYMFHYVRDSKFNYYHFDIKEFENKIIELKKKYKFINNEELKKLIIQKKDLTNYIMFTFDDGTIDHYLLVYPILKKHNITATFFIGTNIFEERILDVQLIHSLLEKIDFDILYNQLLTLLKNENINILDLQIKNLKNYDDAKVSTFKQILQSSLQKDIREKILFELCNINKISTKFNDYYLNISQILEMKANGMAFGMHGVNHQRMSLLSENEQLNEILECLSKFKNKEMFKEIDTYAYPFGDYNNKTLYILNHNGIKYAYTTERRDFSVKDNCLLIPRYDCNELKEVK